MIIPNHLHLLHCCDVHRPFEPKHSTRIKHYIFPPLNIHPNRPTTSSQRHVRLRQFRSRLLFCREATSKRAIRRFPSQTGRELQLAVIQGFLALFLHSLVDARQPQRQQQQPKPDTHFILFIRQTLLLILIPQSPSSFGQRTNWWLFEFGVRFAWSVWRMESSAKYGWWARRR